MYPHRRHCILYIRGVGQSHYLIIMSLTNSYCTQVQRDALKSQLVDLVAQGKMDSLMVDKFDRMCVKLVLYLAKEMSEADATELPITCAVVFFDPAPTPPPPPTYPKIYLRRRKTDVDFRKVLQELKTKFELEFRFSRVVKELKMLFELSPTRSRVPCQFHPPCHLRLCEPSV